MTVVAVLLVCIAATSILVGATVVVPITEAPTEDEVPECIEAMKYLRYINDTTTSNSEASDLLLNSFHTKIDSSTSALSAKADQSLENIASLTRLTSTVKTYVDKSAKEISSLNAKVDSSAEVIDALSNRTTAIEDATGQLANVVHALLGKVENITAQQV